MAGAKLKTEITSTGADTFIKDTKKCKEGVADFKKESDKCTTSLNNKSNAERRALLEVKKHQRELKRTSKEAKEFKNKCNDISGTLNNLTSKLGLNIKGLGTFTTKLGIAGAACGVAGAAVSKLISSNDSLGDSFTTLKNQVSDVWDAMFRIGHGNIGDIWKQSANVTKALDDMQTNVPLIEAQLRGVTFQYDSELALAQDINLEESERLVHLANAKKLLAQMNELELRSIEFREKYAKQQLQLNWKKMGGNGQIDEKAVNRLLDKYNTGELEKYLKDNEGRYKDLVDAQKKSTSMNTSAGVIQLDNPNYRELSSAEKSMLKVYENYKAFLKLVNDEEMQKGLITFIDTDNSKKQAKAAVDEANKTISRVEKRIKDSEERKAKAAIESAKKEREAREKEAEREAAIEKAKLDKIYNYNNQMSHLQSKKQNMQALGIDTKEIDKTIALLDEKMAQEGIEGAGQFAENFKKKLEEELKKINTSFTIQADMTVSDASDLFSGVQSNLPKAETVKSPKSTKTPKVDMSSVYGIREAMDAWRSYYDELENLAEGNAEKLAEIAEERTEKEKELAEDLKEKQKANTISTIDAYANMVGSIGSLLGDLADQAEEGSQKQKRLKKAEFTMNLAMAMAQGVASAMQAGWPACIPAAISTVATVAAMFAKMPKFANGGIVNGTSMVGDNLVARVNSGEMILNNRQQKRLFNLLNNNGVYSNQTVTQQVVFEIKGKDLKATLDNYSRKYRTNI